MSVLERADAWGDMTVSLEDEPDEAETTPLNSREPSPVKQPGGGGAASSAAAGRARVQPTAMMPRAASHAELEAAANAMHDTGRMGADLRKSRMSYMLIVLFIALVVLDVLLLLELVSAIELVGATSAYGEAQRSLARVGQLVTCVFTLLLGSYSLVVHRRWQVSLPRFAAAAATSFALLPEYTTIALVLDVGKLAFPYGNRVMLVTIMMMGRVTVIAILLRLAYIAGVRRGLISQKKMPEMLRTLVSLEGFEQRGLGDVAPQAERPLTVDLLEKLVVFLTPRRLGERPKEGAGLARNSMFPLALFALLLTSAACWTEYERLRYEQEPLLEAYMARALADESMSDLGFNSTARLSWRPPSAQPVPPVTTFLVIVSGVNLEVGQKILGRAFDASVNPLCALDVQTRCESHTMRNVAPSTSLPNWIAALTGASPTVRRRVRRRDPRRGVCRAPFLTDALPLRSRARSRMWCARLPLSVSPDARRAGQHRHRPLPL